jgi:hypothetical protein
LSALAPPKVIAADPTAGGSAGAPPGGRVVAMTEGSPIDPVRLTEAAGEAALVLGLVALPVAWRVLDTSLAAVLAGMLMLLTAAIYALHAVTFDCFRLTGPRPKGGFSLTHREE